MLEKSLAKLKVKPGADHQGHAEHHGSRWPWLTRPLGNSTGKKKVWREVIERRMATSQRALNEQLQLGRNLVKQQKYAEAEPVLRTWLTGREKLSQPHGWATFETKSLLGAALVGQKKYADAEPLLLAGYEGLQQFVSKNPPDTSFNVRQTEARERLVQLYEAWGQYAKADAWQQKLQTHHEAEKKSAKPKEK